MSIFARAHRGTVAVVETVEEAVKDPESPWWYWAESPMRAFGYGMATWAMSTLAGKARNIAHRSGHVDIDIQGNEKTRRIKTHGNAQVVEYAIQEHDADRAGLHWDFQINMDGQGHRWVIKKMKMPPLHDRPLKAIQQPTHVADYVDFEGEIKEGYGKGTTYNVDRGQMEVLHSDNDNVDFVIYKGKYQGRYKMKRWYYTEDGKSHVHKQGEKPYGKPSNEWLLIQKKDGPEYPPHYDRPPSRYKSVKQEFDTEEYIVTKKEDGTHSLLHINTKKYHRNVLASRRPPAESNKSHRARGGILHQEDHLPWIRDMEIAILYKLMGHLDVSSLLRAAGLPYSKMRVLSGTLNKYAIFRIVVEIEDFDNSVFHVEVYHDLGHSHISGILNSDPLKGRETQEVTGKAKVSLLDVRKYQGKDTTQGVPYSERRAMMERFAKYHPEVEVPETPRDGESHREFHDRIIEDGGEGTMAIHNDQEYGGDIYKIKGHMDYNYRGVYYIVGFTEGKGKYAGNGVGAVYYSDRPNGEPVGKAAGMDDGLRREMYANKEEYIGKKVTIESPHPIEKGKAVRAPDVVEVERGSEPDIER